LAFLVEIFGEWKWSSVVGFCPKFKSKEEFLVSVIDLARTRRGENFRGLYFALEGQ